MENNVVGSIVVFSPKLDLLKTTIRSFLESSTNSEVFIWDNSAEDKISAFLQKEFGPQVKYFKSPSNLGYGRGHNEVFRRVDSPYKYFCILNPDIILPKSTIPSLVSYMEAHPQLGLASCIIRGDDGKIHEVHKKLPTFFAYIKSLLFRFLKIESPPSTLVEDRLNSEPYALPILSGCFLFFTRSHYKELNGFDDSFFLYFEDYDLTLRSYLMKKSILLPSVSIVHKWARSSHRNWRLQRIQG